MRYKVRTFDALLPAACVLIAFLLAGPALMIPLHIPLSYNEGWNAYFAQRAIDPRSGPLYPPPDSLVFNNYPPLSFYLVGTLGRLAGGDVIVAGRLVALAALLACAVLLGLCVRRLGGTTRGAVAASGLLLLFASTAFRGYLAIDDPQWLAHALMLGGLAVLLGGAQGTRPPASRAVVAALLVTAGGFVKHNLIGLPLAVTGWLLLVRPRAALAWLAAACAGVAGGAALTAMLHGQLAFADILQHRRIVRSSRAGPAVMRALPLLPMLLIAAAGWQARARGDRPMLLAILFVAVSLAAGIAQRLGDGVNINAYFETLVALCLTTGLVVSRSFAAPPSWRGMAIGPVALVLLAALPPLLGLPRHLAQAWNDLEGRAARVRAWQPVIARLASSPGPVACEDLSLCYWAGRPFAFDQFNLNQSLLLGGPTARLDRVAGTHLFRIVEYRGTLPDHPDPAGLRRDPLLAALLAQHYAPTLRGPDGTVLLEPAPP